MLKIVGMKTPKSFGKAQYIVDPEGKKTAVVLDLESYRQMVEDLRDLKTIAQRKRNPKLSASELTARLKKHGRL